jgi:hypothetical protein
VLFAGDHGGTGAAEEVQNDFACLATVCDRVLDQSDWLHRWMFFAPHGAIEVPDGGLGSICVPVVRGGGLPAVQDGLVLPVVILPPGR